MEIYDLMQEKYNKEEYAEILKLFCIRENNLNLFNNFKTIINLQIETIDSLKKNINENDIDISILNDQFYENNKMFKHILCNTF
ncbi:hypothetical protein BMW23_0356 [Bodo saltans virus]|jgi:NADH/NAD ratio-sensing transcriptional regulator Rex|uniref:Uncharacterized protein n=1 Tax=Bodo saltans virus TaxID=2024608 RepID=A0A2H4UTZ4_9VIRU|nr:hypothetical protein QJ851_gp0348 [Bodo saltans virus]ATZ80411.1 hypothetical protein BMW23_0356 [Bodo saltans virus]